ncbi:MAG: UDP-3-O-(3-hydroxymyristoyl)glucosamine N-acyltransferase [Ignavibacteriae bacterium]|nr:UDP-3-O-(3-hydroxymyristoyl)glucosamine N-acyltransferase [Ignavibacteriota bacterium]
MTLSEIARLLNGEISSGAEIEIERLAKIEDAGEGDITFFANPKYANHLSKTSATAILITKNIEAKELAQRTTPIHVVRVEDSYRAFLQLIDIFHPKATPLQKGIHPSAVISPIATLGEGVAIGACVVIGDGCTIGKNVTLHPGVVLSEHVSIDEGSLLYQNVSVREGCNIGKRVIIHPGTVVGSDGFGFAPTPDGTYEKIPQRGIVIIEDDVEVGANCTIDRATIGETRIKRGAKLDNLIQVAHNVVIGENTVIAAQAGISGSTKVGKNCVIAGQVGLVGHITLGDRTTIGAQSGVSKSVNETGTTIFGSPAKEARFAFRVQGAIQQLPDLLVEVRSLRNEIERLKSEIEKTT